MKGFFVTGIHTGIGKTVISAILVEALRADYWKPVQSGGMDYTDSDFIRGHAVHFKTIHPEAFKLKEPVSPHYAAELEGKVIEVPEILCPKTDNLLIAEGAGGILSPLSAEYLVADLARHLQLPIILVSMNYLGSINHTLLSIEALRSRDLEVAGIIFNGMANPASEEYILNYSGLKRLGSVPFTDKIDSAFISFHSEKFEKLHELVG